ncbi:MAG: hypothetical protein IKR68_07965 [Lachnospiraceae bacterium]|nr:hypothetical protein [Lachnospiraceae bacterium]
MEKIINRDIRFWPVFIGATTGVVLEVVATLVDEIIVGNLFTDAAFAAVNLIEPYTVFEVFIAYLVTVAGAALIVRAHGAGDHEKMSELFSQTMIVCGACGMALTLIYVLFTPQLVRFVADNPAVYNDAYDYFKVMRFYPLIDVFDTFMFAYVLYRNGFIHFYTAIISRISVNALLSWYLGSRMGLMGIGLASILSLVVALTIKLTFLFSSKHSLRFRWYFNPREVLEVIVLGFPESSISAFFVIMEMAINGFTLKRYGVDGVAAVAVVINIFEFMIYISEGISEYEIVAVNDSIGKESSSSMDRAVKTTKKAVFIEGAVFLCLVFFMASAIPEAFDVDSEETARLAAVMLRILAPTAVFVCLSRATAMFYLYTGRVSRTIIIFCMAIAVMPVLFGVVFGQIAVEGVAAGLAFGPAMTVGLMCVFVRFVKKEKLFDYSILKLNG